MKSFLALQTAKNAPKHSHPAHTHPGCQTKKELHPGRYAPGPDKEAKKKKFEAQIEVKENPNDRTSKARIGGMYKQVCQ